MKENTLKYRNGLPTKKSLKEFITQNGVPPFYTFSQIRGSVNILFQRETLNEPMKRISEKLKSLNVPNVFNSYERAKMHVGGITFIRQPNK